MRLCAACCLASLALAPSAASACPLLAPDDVRPVLKKPVDGLITTGFGMRTHPVLQKKYLHTGTDFSAAAGTPVRAAAAGEVVSAEVDEDYGNRVLMRHGGGMLTAYSHLLQVDVKPGDCIAQGTVIGGVGATGQLAFGPHLHFEVLRHGAFVEPLAALHWGNESPQR